MKRFLFISLTITLLLGLILTGCAAEETSQTPVTTPETVTPKAIVLSMAAPWPAPDPVALECKKFVDGFNERAGGRYVIEIHYGESLVTLMESFDAVRTNTVDLAGFPPGVFQSVEPRFYAAEIPFLFVSSRADGNAQMQFVPYYNEVLPEKYNQRMLGSFSGTALEIISNKPIKTMEDWKGIVCMSVSPQSAEVIEALGGSSVPIPFTEGYQALQKGTVDAVMVAPAAMIVFKLYEVAKYFTTAYICSAPSCLTVNEDVFQAMPKDIQDILLDEGVKWEISANNYFIDGAAAERQFMEDNGLETYALPAAERERWRAVIEPVQQKYLDLLGDFGVTVKQIADDLNTEYPY